jgi:hypothetical protein
MLVSVVILTYKVVLYITNTNKVFYITPIRVLCSTGFAYFSGCCFCPPLHRLARGSKSAFIHNFSLLPSRKVYPVNLAKPVCIHNFFTKFSANLRCEESVCIHNFCADFSPLVSVKSGCIHNLFSLKKITESRLLGKSAFLHNVYSFWVLVFAYSLYKPIIALYSINC